MSYLNCTVTNCAYNENALCVLENIHVEGKNAAGKRDTCCASFAGGIAGGSYSNSAFSAAARPETGIRCEAGDCVYNEARQCRAARVNICGCGACSCGETQCDTFEARASV